MLAQVLNRDFTLGTVAATEKQLRSVIANRRAGILGRPDDPREIPTDELEELADALAGAFAAESAPEDGPRPAQPGEQAPPPKSDYAYVPGNPVVGLVQVALEAHAAGAMDVEERTMDDDRRGGPLPVVAEEIYRQAIASPGRPLADVLAELRARSYERDPFDDSWAAYCLFGDPLAALQAV